MSQFRQNPISKHWILIAPNRAKRFEDISSRPATPQNLPERLPECVFCPGNEDQNPQIARFPDNDNWLLRVIPNKYEAVSHTPLSRHAEFYVSRSGSGDHEVIITRKHNEPVALQSIQTVELTLHIFRQRTLDLSERQYLAYVQIFHNHGRDAGATLVHPHHQILATPMLPTGIHDEMVECYHYFLRNDSCIYCDIMREELRTRERIIYEDQDFVVLLPFASRVPFEMWILPRVHCGRFQEITDVQITRLAYVLKLALAHLYVKLNNPPLNFYIHNLPEPNFKHLANEARAYHWHLVIFPRMTIWAGFEYATGIPVNPVLPEHAAEFLRSGKQIDLPVL